MRILMAENDRLLSEALGRRLTDAGHAVDVFATVADSEIAWRSTSYDLSIVDVMLDDGDGRTGPGLPRSFPDSGFSRFVRGTGDSRSGSGLGLAICESAMRRMGGDFILERADRRKGAAFRMMFKPTGPTPSS